VRLAVLSLLDCMRSRRSMRLGDWRRVEADCVLVDAGKRRMLMLLVEDWRCCICGRLA